MAVEAVALHVAAHGDAAVALLLLLLLPLL